MGDAALQIALSPVETRACFQQVAEAVMEREGDSPEAVEFLLAWARRLGVHRLDAKVILATARTLPRVTAASEQVRQRHDGCVALEERTQEVARLREEVERAQVSLADAEAKETVIAAQHGNLLMALGGRVERAEADYRQAMERSQRLEQDLEMERTRLRQVGADLAEVRTERMKAARILRRLEKWQRERLGCEDDDARAVLRRLKRAYDSWTSLVNDHYFVRALHAAFGMVNEEEHWRRLVVRGGPMAGREFQLRSQSAIAGRLPSCGIPLVGDPRASPEHARFEFRDDDWFVMDNDSESGTWVNGVRVQEEVLDCGDLVRLGASDLILENLPVKKRAKAAEL